jgi:hypothetical protein
MARIDPYELGDDDDTTDVPLDAPRSRDQDGVGALRDTEAEVGDEEEIDDDYDLDDRAAREAGVELDDRDEPEPGLN